MEPMTPDLSALAELKQSGAELGQIYARVHTRALLVEDPEGRRRLAALAEGVRLLLCRLEASASGDCPGCSACVDEDVLTESSRARPACRKGPSWPALAQAIGQNRADDLEDYVLQVRDDPSGLRGIWTRLRPATLDGGATRLDIRAGREGHDVRLALVAGQTITAALLAQLLDALSAGRAPDVDYGCPPLDEASLELTREALRSAAPLLGAVLLGHLPAGRRPSAVSARSAFRAAAPAIGLALLSALPQGLRPDADEAAAAEDEGGRAAASELVAALLQQDPLGTEAPWWVSEADGDLYATGHHGQSVHVGAMETPQHARLVCALRNAAPQLLQLLHPAGLGPSAAPAPRPALSFAQAQALAAQGTAQDVARRILDLWEQVCPGPAALIGEDGDYQIDVGGRRVIAEAEDRPHGRYLAAAYSGAPVLALEAVRRQAAEVFECPHCGNMTSAPGAAAGGEV